MNSPYSPPRSASGDDGVEIDPALRRKGAFLFAVIPALILLLFQIGLIVDSAALWAMTTWEPTFYFLPTTILAALTGYYGAGLCARASRWGTVRLGAGFGCIWALGAQVAGNLVLRLEGAPRDDQVAKFMVIAMLLMPFAIVLCACLRYLGKKHAQ